MQTQEEKNLRIETIIRYETGSITLSEAQARLRLGKRQVLRLVSRYCQYGLSYFQTGERRGRKATAITDKNKALTILGQDLYKGFAPSLASEMLAERHGIKLSKETIRQLMIKSGLWQAKVKKSVKKHLTRERRPRFGELVQIDASPHDWFEGRGDKCALIVFIDDATGRILNLKFAPAEATFPYMECLFETIKYHGIPLALYSDKHSVFRKERPNQQPDIYSEPTQFHRACEELNIELINAHSPQAKGRVERCNRTLQDRLIKLMRLENISSIEQANEFAPLFIAKHNLKYAKPPKDDADAHQINLKSDDELMLILSKQDTRRVAKDNSISFQNSKFLLDNNFKNRLLGQSVRLYRCFNGQIFIKWNDITIPFSQTNSQPLHLPKIATSKNINDFVDKLNSFAA